MTVTYSKDSPSISIVDTAETGNYFIHVVTKVTTSAETIFYSNITTSSSSTSVLTDGLYRVESIKLPSTDGGSYYTDGTKIYDSDGNEITVATLVANVEGTSQNIIIYYIIYTNLIETEKEILDLLYDCKSDPIKARYRDILYMGLSVVDYLLTDSLYNEANRLIEKLESCGTVTSTCNCR
jgi:hypothetical protein